MNSEAAASRLERYFKSNAKEITGWDDDLLAMNKAIAADLQASEALSAQIEQANRREQGVDMDYDTEPSCASYKTYVRNHEDGSTKVLSVKIACGKATCRACFRRLVVPKWTYNLIGLIGSDRELHLRRIEGETIVDVEGKLRKIKQRVLRNNGRWLVIWQQVELEHASDHRAEAVLFSTVDTGESFAFYPLLEHGQYERLAFHLRSLVGNIDRRVGRPIRFHRDYSAPERPSLGLWRTKFNEVRLRDDVWSGIVGKDAAARIHKECRASRKPSNRNYIGFRLPDGCEAIASDLPHECEVRPLKESLVRSAEEADWFSSGGWRPKQRFYEEAELLSDGIRIRTPSDLREITETKDLDSTWSSPIVDGASAFIGEKISGEKILQAILRNPKKFDFSKQAAQHSS